MSPNLTQSERDIKIQKLRAFVYQTVFFTDTRAGRNFDVALIVAILLSILALMLESVYEIEKQWGAELYILDWVFTIIFTIEYGIRIWSSNKPMKYIFSFYGLVDLLSILPLYTTFIFTGVQSFSIIRSLRLLRVFRVLKLVQFVGEASSMLRAIKASMNKIIVFIAFILIVSNVIGTLMYMIEGRENGFTSIPRSIYWAIVTLTTVGYGDVTPSTPLGQVLAVLLMILGYGVIAVPTGLVTAEAIKVSHEEDALKKSPPAVADKCSNCGEKVVLVKARFCSSCGAQLKP
ncbi:MAG: ion transporter [Flavobacteriales bacterium]|nr:ion transporter [Flavobacteriales bacterium]